MSFSCKIDFCSLVLVIYILVFVLSRYILGRYTSIFIRYCFFSILAVVYVCTYIVRVYLRRGRRSDYVHKVYLEHSHLHSYAADILV